MASRTSSPPAAVIGSRLASLWFMLILFLISSAHATNGSKEIRRPSIMPDLLVHCSAIFSKPATYCGLAAYYAAPEILESESTRPFKEWIGSGIADATFEYGDMLGNPVLHLAGAATLFYGGRLCHSSRFMQVGSDMISAQIITGAISLSTKFVTQRTRPDGAPYSFPSGHSSTAFATAGIVLNRFGLVPGIIAEGVAGYVALSRLQENKHFISDVVAGAILGNYVAYCIARTQSVEGTLQVFPGSNHGTAMIFARISF